ncbi:MAG: transposase [Spirochaetia bacterium]|nr:transposase [Spirochaetia bacterium]
MQKAEYVYVWADGVYCNARLDNEKLCLLVIIGVTVEGKKELVAVHQGVRESEQSWLEVLRELKSRGLAKAPKLAICDGVLGFQNSVDKVCGQMKIQRCWFYKMGKRAQQDTRMCPDFGKKKPFRIFLWQKVHIRTSNPIESMFATVRL